MLRARGQAPARAHCRSPSTRQGRSWDTTLTPAMRVMVSCALGTAPSPHSTLRARGQAPASAPLVYPSIVSTPQELSRHLHLTQTMLFTLSCALRTAL